MRIDPSETVTEAANLLTLNFAIIEVLWLYEHVVGHIKFVIFRIALLTRFGGTKPIVIFNRSSQLTKKNHKLQNWRFIFHASQLNEIKCWKSVCSVNRHSPESPETKRHFHADPIRFIWRQDRLTVCHKTVKICKPIATQIDLKSPRKSVTTTSVAVELNSDKTCALHWAIRKSPLTN